MAMDRREDVSLLAAGLMLTLTWGLYVVWLGRAYWSAETSSGNGSQQLAHDVAVTCFVITIVADLVLIFFCCFCVRTRPGLESGDRQQQQYLPWGGDRDDQEDWECALVESLCCCSD